MSDGLAGALNRTMGRFGYRQFIIVRPTAQGPEIVDGEHRWRELLSVRGEDSEVVVIEQDLDEIQARLSTLGMNHPRGGDDAVRLAQLVLDLRDRLGVSFEQISEAAGYGAEHLGELERIAMPVEDSDLPPSSIEHPVAEVHIALYSGQYRLWQDAMEKALRTIEARPDTIVLAGAQVGVYDQAMKKSQKLGETRARSRALELICAAFLAEPEESYET